ncbi:MAG: 30S ribosomal protein S6 [Sphingobacteriales bacterium]|nr:30S ribosomal protein S6 [Sphingobacteriales bacterium]
MFKIKNFETVIIFTPVLSEADAKKKISDYLKYLQDKGCTMLEENFWGIRQLAYPINRKTTGIYFVCEYQGPSNVVEELEVLFKRDVEILRFLTVRLDKYAVKYNEDRRNGLIGKKRKSSSSGDAAETAVIAAPVAVVIEEEVKPIADGGDNTPILTDDKE